MSENQQQFDIFARTMAFVDLETTGLDDRVHEIIEIGIVIADQKTLKIHEEWQQLVNPQFPERSSELNRTINGFNEVAWASAPFLAQVIPTLCEKLSQHELWAWNIQFEWRFLKTAFDKHGMDIHEVLGDYHGFDVVPLAKEELRRQNVSDVRFSLSSISAILGLKVEPYPHRALSGAKAAFEVYKELRKRSQ